MKKMIIVSIALFSALKINGMDVQKSPADIMKRFCIACYSQVTHDAIFPLIDEETYLQWVKKINSLQNKIEQQQLEQFDKLHTYALSRTKLNDENKVLYAELIGRLYQLFKTPPINIYSFTKNNSRDTKINIDELIDSIKNIQFSSGKNEKQDKKNPNTLTNSSNITPRSDNATPHVNTSDEENSDGLIFPMSDIE